MITFTLTHRSPVSVPWRAAPLSPCASFRKEVGLFDEVVFAGVGEPLLRWPVVKEVRAYFETQTKACLDASLRERKTLRVSVEASQPSKIYTDHAAVENGTLQEGPFVDETTTAVAYASRSTHQKKLDLITLKKLLLEPHRERDDLGCPTTPCNQRPQPAAPRLTLPSISAGGSLPEKPPHNPAPAARTSNNKHRRCCCRRSRPDRACPRQEQYRSPFPHHHAGPPRHQRLLAGGIRPGFGLMLPHGPCLGNHRNDAAAGGGEVSAKSKKKRRRERPGRRRRGFSRPGVAKK